jgi:hypothetical protein
MENNKLNPSDTIMGKYSTEQWNQRIKTDFAFSMPNREQIGKIQQIHQEYTEFALKIITSISSDYVQNMVYEDLLKNFYIAVQGVYRDLRRADTDYSQKVG